MTLSTARTFPSDLTAFSPLPQLSHLHLKVTGEVDGSTWQGTPTDPRPWISAQVRSLALEHVLQSDETLPYGSPGRRMRLVEASDLLMGATQLTSLSLTGLVLSPIEEALQVGSGSR